MVGFKEWLENESLISEMAIDRKKAEKTINSLGEQIFLHLVKVLYWEDELNYNKHCNDIDNWLNLVQEIELKPNNKKPKETDFYNWLYDEFHSSERQLTLTIKNKLKNYHSLTVLVDINSLYYIIQTIYKRLSVDLSQDKFESIKNYIK